MASLQAVRASSAQAACVPFSFKGTRAPWRGPGSVQETCNMSQDYLVFPEYIKVYKARAKGLTHQPK